MQNTMNIWAVGRNYADHAKELGNSVPQAEAEPMIFLKAGSTVVTSGEKIHLPSWSNDVHHELEIALRFGAEFEFSHIALALDLTARDIQNRLRTQGHPWTLAKSFRDSCALGEAVPVSRLPGGTVAAIDSLEFTLTINGQPRQHGFARDMIFKAPQLRAYVLDRFPVRRGDWLLTGTPAGVGPLRNGDRIEAALIGIRTDSWTVDS